MFERFTEQARQVVVLAQDEARTLKHNYIGTEHLLLGLLRDQQGLHLAERVLGSLGITVERARAQVVRIVGPCEELTSKHPPFTPRAKKVLELALREALSLRHNYIGPEHVLLGLVRQNEGVAARILLDFDADSEQIRNEVIRMLSRRGGAGSGTSPPSEPAGAAATPEDPTPAPSTTPVRPDIVEGASETGLQDTMSRLIRREDELYVELRALQADIDIVRNELANRRKRRGEPDP